MILAQAFLEKFLHKPSEAVFSTVFRHNFRWEAASDVTSGVAVEWVGLGARVKFGDYIGKTVLEVFFCDDRTNERT